MERVLVILENSRLRALLHFSLESSFSFDVVPVETISGAEQMLDQQSEGFSLVISDYLLGADENQLLFSKVAKLSNESKFLLLGDIEREQFETSDGRHADGIFPHLEMLVPLNDCLKEHFTQALPDTMEEYTSITLPVLSFFSELPGDIFIRFKSGRFLKLFLAGDQINESDLERYRHRGVTELFIDRKLAKWVLAKSHLEMESIISEKQISIDCQEIAALDLDTVIASLEKEFQEELTQDSSRNEIIQEALDNQGSTYVTGDTKEDEESEFVKGDLFLEGDSEYVTGDTKEDEESAFVTGDGHEYEESEFVTGDGHEYEESEFVTGDGQEIQESQFVVGSISGDSNESSSSMELKAQDAALLKDDKKLLKTIFTDIEKMGEMVDDHLSGVVNSDELTNTIATATAKDAVPARRALLMKELKKKRPLGKILPRIKLGRTDETFFRDRTFLVRTISAALAQALEWDSEASLEKLLYISHKHDLLMVNNPRLARVQSKEEMEEREEEFSDEERQLFYDHPKIMSELIKADPVAPPDSESIILQHHELPNRAGFPQGLNSPRVVPFAVLLNVSIDFAQYIIDNPGWKFSNYLKRALSLYTSGGSFAKVVRALKKVEHTFR
jgi:hypothetical protein